MARWNDLPWRDDVYAAADVWKARCLLQDKALFGDSPVWTKDNLETLQKLVVSNADFGSGTFWEKLHEQLNGASPDVIQLAAEIMWLVFLFPLGQGVGHVSPSTKASTKLTKVKDILYWANLPTPTGEVVIVEALSGIGRTGMFYKKYFHAIRYMLQVFVGWKEFSSK